MEQDIINKAIEIIKGQCNEDGYCTLTLMDTDNRPNSTTITPSKADGIKKIFFCCGYGTRTERVNFRNVACVCFNSHDYHISLKGTIHILTDKETKEKMWYPGLSNHFTGPNDSKYVVLEFNTDQYTLFIDYKTIRGIIE